MKTRNDSRDIVALIGARIESLRKERGLSLHSVAQQVDCSVEHLSSIESGCSSMQVLTLMKIAQALRVEPYDLLNYDSENDDIGYIAETMRQHPKTRSMVKARAKAWQAGRRGG